MKNEIMQILNQLSQAINAHYGYVKLEGSNYGEPVINSGPCGPFANMFFHEWNKRFSEKVAISFIMDTTNGECHHVLIRLPNGLLYDGGIGVHDESHYDARFKIEDMKVYDYQLLDERSYGLNRSYPRFCPNFNLDELTALIVNYLIRSIHMIEMRPLEEADISVIVKAFDQIGWDKPATLFQAYLKEQKANERYVWVAYQQNQFVGYITLKVHSEYLPFQKENIPEIKDLNVLPACRKQGIGSALMKRAEDKASAYNTQVGIGVGLTSDYGNAQRLYVKSGYIPDGNGVTYHHESVKWGVDYKVDDDLVLWFIKDLPSK